MIWDWERRSRRLGSVVTLGLVWLSIGGLSVGLDLHPAIAGVILALTLPQLIDVLRDTTQRLAISADRVAWQVGRRSGEIALDADTTVSLRRRLDGGVRIVVTDRCGRETRLPPERAPPLGPLETALQQSFAQVRRDPFRLI